MNIIAVRGKLIPGAEAGRATGQFTGFRLGVGLAMNAALQTDPLSQTRDALLALIDAQAGLIGRVESTGGLLAPARDGDGGDASPWDAEAARRWRALLTDERSKLRRSEMVLAVVGTMKAGKSTTINAIVGTEVLPNRNQPMTTVPTLIRHEPGRETPRLTLQSAEVLNGVADAVAAKLAELDRAGRIDALNLANEPDGEALIGRLSAGTDDPLFRTAYDGQADVFGCLRALNDLIRLSRDPSVAVELPDDALVGLDALPVIDVAFYHLRGLTGDRLGRLVLLDTPGPNEAGQSVQLRRVVRDQLARASAVLAVLDYTQLRSEAEAEMRDDLLELVERSGDRLFVVINKFDQKDRNSLDVEETRGHVVRGLLQGRIDAARVFPVSARNAYLANRAGQQLARDGRLELSDGEPWIADFAKQGLGVTWRRDITNAMVVSDAIRELWAGSRFDEPVRQIVQHGAIRAAIGAAHSAIEKIDRCAEALTSVLDLRRSVIDADQASLRELIDGIEIDLNALDGAQGAARRRAFDLVTTYAALLQAFDDDARALLTTGFQRYFAAGRIDWGGVAAARTGTPAALADSWRAVCGEDASHFEAAIAATDLLPAPGPPVAPTFDPAQPILQFETEAPARRIANRVANDIQRIVTDVARVTSRRFALAAEGLEAATHDVLAKAIGPVLEKTQQRVADHGFELVIHFPQPRLEGLAIDYESIGEVGLSQRMTVRTERQATAGMLGSVGRWWKGRSSRWGYTAVRSHQMLHQVDIDMIREAALKTLQERGGVIRAIAEDYVQSVLEPRLITYFQDLRGHLDGFRDVLRSGIEDHRRRERSLTDLRAACAEFTREANDQTNRSAALRDRLEAIAPDEVEVALPDAVPMVGYTLAEGAAATQALTTEAAAAPADIEATLSGTAADAAMVGRLLRQSGQRLELTYQERTLILDSWGGMLVVGRGSDCSLIVHGRRASRRHAELYFQDGSFIVKDQSTNGTFVQFEGGEPMLIHRIAGKLTGTGLLGLGIEPGRDPEHTIRFHCHAEAGA